MKKGQMIAVRVHDLDEFQEYNAKELDLESVVRASHTFRFVLRRRKKKENAIKAYAKLMKLGCKPVMFYSQKRKEYLIMQYMQIECGVSCIHDMVN